MILYQITAGDGTPFKPIERRIQYEHFNVHTPPNISKNTRIITALGVTEHSASHSKDSWLISDFFAFWHLLQGLTDAQAWIHCLDLDESQMRDAMYVHHCNQSPYRCEYIPPHDTSVCDKLSCDRSNKVVVKAKTLEHIHPWQIATSVLKNFAKVLALVSKLE